MSASPATRRWLLKVYDPAKRSELVHQATCTGDAGLNDAMNRAESKWPKARMTAEPAS